jgi:hypothetical protein
MFDPNFVQDWAIVVGGPPANYGLTEDAILATGVTDLWLGPMRALWIEGGGENHVGIHFRGTYAQKQKIMNMIQKPLTTAQGHVS